MATLALLPYIAFASGFVLLVIIVMPTAPMSFGQLLFVLPCGLVLLFGAWLGLAERRARP